MDDLSKFFFFKKKKKKKKKKKDFFPDLFQHSNLFKQDISKTMREAVLRSKSLGHSVS